MGHSGSQPRLGAANAGDEGEIKRVLSADVVASEPLPNANVQVISRTTASQVPFSLPALDHPHPHPGDVLAWAYGEGRIHADPLMQRLEAIGALLNVELMIVPPFPRSEIMAALDELATPPPPIEAAAGASEEIDAEVKRVLSADTTANELLPNTDTQMVCRTATSLAPFPLPALDHTHPGDVLAWAYGEGRRIHADPLMQRLEAIGALLDVELDGDVPPPSLSP